MPSRAASVATTHWHRPSPAWSPAPVTRLALDLSAAFRLGPEARGPRIVTALADAVHVPGLLDETQCRPDAHCYARHVIHADPEGRFTVLALAWGPGQRSPVHAHRTWCAFAVRQGVLAETLFAFDMPARDAVAKGTHERRPGYACFAPAGLERGHRLANTETSVAVSIHVYGVEAARITTDVNEIFDCA